MRPRPSFCMAAVCAALTVPAAIAAPASADGDQPRRRRLAARAAAAAVRRRSRSLDVADMDGSSGDERLLFGTLQGVVNRERPRVYLIEDADEGNEAWPSTFAVPQRRVADPWTLVERYRDELRGMVVYDPAQPDSINVATTLAGLRDAVVASPELAARLSAAPYDLPVLDDLRGRFESRIDAYRWQYEHLWPRTTHRLLIGASPYRGEAFRFADGTASVTYRFDVPATAAALAATVEMWNQFKVSASSDGAAWQVVLAGGRPRPRRLQPRRVRDRPQPLRRRVDRLPQVRGRAAAGRLGPGDPLDRRHGRRRGGRPRRARHARRAGVHPRRAGHPAVRHPPVRPAARLRRREPRDGRLARPERARGARPVRGDPPRHAGEQRVRRLVRPGRRGREQRRRARVAARQVRRAGRLGVEPDGALGARAACAARRGAPRAPRLRDKTYVSFFMTEGDNLQYNQHKLRALWDDPARGTCRSAGARAR